jgi:predicted esterase
MKFFKLFLVVLFAAVTALAQEDFSEADDAPPQPKIMPDAVETTPLIGEAVVFITDDDYHLRAVYSAPPPPAEPQAGEENKEPVRYVILLHDIGKNKSSYYKFTRALKANKMEWLAFDFRGHGENAGELHYAKFDREGINNQFNLMVKDVNAAVNFLKEQEVAPENIFIVGSGLGANVAAKSMVFNQDIGGFALLTPTTNNRDVLTIQGVRVNKKPVFIGVASNMKKQFFDASIIRNNAYLALGPGKTAFATAYDREGAEMLDVYLTAALIQWLKTPERPALKPDIKIAEETAPAPEMTPEPEPSV